LVSFDEEETNLSADGLEISFNTKNTIDFELKWDFIDDIFKLSRVVFFESPKKLSFYQHFCQNHQQKTSDHFQK
jgi:hypothetical protein